MRLAWNNIAIVFLKSSNVAAICPFLLKLHLLRAEVPLLGDSNLCLDGDRVGKMGGFRGWGDSWAWDAKVSYLYGFDTNEDICSPIMGSQTPGEWAERVRRWRIQIRATL